MAEKIKLVRGDNRPYVKLYLKNADGTALNVSGVTTVTVHFRAVGESTILANLLCTKPNGGTDGLVVFNFPGSTLDVPAGPYEGEIEIDFGGEHQTVYDILKFVVREQFQ